MEWRPVSIGDTCLPTSQCDPRTAPDVEITYIDISGIDRDSKIIAKTQTLLGVDAPSRARKEVRSHDILVSTVRPNLNAVAMVPEHLDGQIASTGFCVLRADPKLVYPRFLFYKAMSQEFINFLTARVRGANYPAVTDGIVRSAPLRLPPPTEQQRIIEILDQADLLKKLRSRTDKKVERLLPALFVKMFGDPATNPKGWPLEPFGRLGELDRGKSRHRPRNDPSLLGGPYPFIQTGDVANSGGYIRSYSGTYSEIGLAQSRMWPAGTLCITIAANIAETGILGFDACFPDSVVGFTPGTRTNSGYIRILLSFLKPILERSAPQMAQKNINLEILRNLPVPTPPPELQDKFLEYHDSEIAQNQRRNDSADRLSRLWTTLLNHSYSGDLTSKWRESHMKELLEELEIQTRELNRQAIG